jgi:pimeloyl-ACP methyl ester carboxylesterase
MAEFVLIHGACHRAGVWRAVLPALAALGHHAIAPSLIGRSMKDNARAIVNASPKGAVLVGHSAGGFAAHAAALSAPDHFAGLIYLCAFIPQRGNSVADLRRAAPDDALGPAIRKHGARYDFDPNSAVSLFFHDCPSPDAHASGLRPDPIAPVQSPLPDLPANFPRAAIICDHDRAIAPAYQMQMAAGLILRHLPCGHAPFFAQPQHLAQTLHEMAIWRVADELSLPPTLP